MTVSVLLVALGLEPPADEARRLLQEELSKTEYVGRRQSLLWAWLQEVFFHIGLPVDKIDMRGVVITILVAFSVILALALYRRVRREHMSVSFSEELTSLSAEEHHARAIELKTTDPTEALKAAFRAIIVRLDATIATASPGRTTGDIAQLISRTYPDLDTSIHAGASKFDIATYSLRTVAPVEPSDVEAMLALDLEIQKRLAKQVAP